MTSPLRAIGIALVLAALSALADDVDEIRRLDKEITVATWTADALWFEKNVADDYMLIAPNGTMRTKLDIIRELATPGLKMEPYEPLETQIRMYGDTAVVTGRMLQRFTLGRIRYANDLRYTDVWVKKKGKWLLVTGHTSNVAVRR
ncbi:MAG TPA: nuclear transport factor 2 family protein [Thermoanaerobaculia bacterium]|nr:nuclear transport factor 2 family protein [Thermoanaerobaculia bacterium]